MKTYKIVIVFFVMLTTISIFSQSDFNIMHTFNNYIPDGENTDNLCVDCKNPFTVVYKTYILNPNKAIGEGRLRASKFYCYYLTLKIYKMVNLQTGEYILYDSIRYEVEPDWYMMYAEVNLADKGFYELKMFHEDGKELAHSLIEIN